MAVNRRKFLVYGSVAFASTWGIKGCTDRSQQNDLQSGGSIPIGSIYDRTGFLSSLGAQQIACQQMAIDEINASGGVLGRPLQLKLYDGQSDVQKTAQLAQQLILQDKVAVLFGCLSSAAREAVRPITNKYKTLYFYPSQYEGGVCDKYTFCGGVTAAGIINKLVAYAANQLKVKTLYTIAADYNFGQTSAKWVNFYSRQYGITANQAEFIPTDVSDFSTTISKIQQAKPDAVVSVLVGDNHEGFFGQWAQSGLKEKIPILAATLSHPYDRDGSERPEKADIIAVRSYWQEDPSPSMKKFVSDFQKKFGTNKYLFELGFDCYVVVKMWAQAVQQAGSLQPEAAIQVLENGMIYQGPQGPVSFDKTHHINHTVYVLKSTKDQRFSLLDGPFREIRATDDGGKCDLLARPDTSTQYTPEI